ncbi:aquaporin family protein, partial [Streptomyces cavourensis]|nr:aquaporin family protein [Streptomyces cavourensis]
MSSSDIFIGETIGTAVLILLGGGVCAAVTLKRSKALNAGWLAITFGWGFAVLTGAYLAGGVSGAHLNPAVTLGLAIKGGTAWGDVPLYLGSQLLGAMIGAVLVYAVYYGQFHAHLNDPEIVGTKSTHE